MARKAPTRQRWLAPSRSKVLAVVAVIAAAAALNAWAAPSAETSPTVTSLRTGAEALEKAGLASYARRQREAAEAIQLWTATHEGVTAEHVQSLEGLAKSLTAGARMWEQTDPRKAEVLKQQAATAETAIAALRPLVGAAPAVNGTAALKLLTVQIKAPAAGGAARIVLVEPARTFTDPSEITSYLKSTAESFRDATIVFQVDEAATFATVRQAVNAVADAGLAGPMQIEGLKLRSASPGQRLGRTPPGPLPEDLQPARTP